MSDYKPYKVIVAYDSETTNYDDNGRKIAFPILHQVGILNGCDIEEVTSDNVETVVTLSMFRDTLDLYEFLDNLLMQHLDYVPVIMCHNLALFWSSGILTGSQTKERFADLFDKFWSSGILTGSQTLRSISTETI